MHSDNVMLLRQAEPDFMSSDIPALTSGFGQLHTNEPDPAKPRKRLMPYKSIDWTGILLLVDNPQRVDKEVAQWLIPSSLLSRTFKTQLDHGEFWLLWADFDPGNPAASVIAQAIADITGNAQCEVYSSRSSTAAVPRTRALIPLGQPLTGADWSMAQEVLNELLVDAGMVPDRASEGPAQLCYLPNRGEHYETRSQRNGHLFYPMTAWVDLIAAKHRAVDDAEQALLAERKAAAARKVARPAPTSSGGASLIETFNAVHHVVDILLRAGYAQRGSSFRHPDSQSGSFSAGVKDGRVHALSSSDALYTGGGGSGAHDAFSAFCALTHGGNQKAALKDAGDNWLTIGTESWNRFEQREWAQQQGQDRSRDQSPGVTLEHGGDGDDDCLDDHPLAKFLDLSNEPMAPRWIVPGFIGSGVVLIAGAPGVGKTSSILPLSMLVAGLHAPGDPLAPRHWRHVVYVAEDVEQARRVVSGLVKYGGLGLNMCTVIERWHIVEAKRLDPKFLVKVGPLYKEQFARTVDGVVVLPLVVLDTRSAVLELDDENSNSEGSRAMALLKQDFQGLPVWLVGHIAKTNLGRSDVAGLTMRGASSFGGDAHQDLFLVAEGEQRYLVRGKTRFEATWKELRIDSKTATEQLLNEYGETETTTLRWAVAAPPEQSRKEVAEQAKERASKEAEGDLRDEVRDVVQAAWAAGAPLNRTGVRAKINRNAEAVGDCIENLVNERWLVEVPVPPKERSVNSRSAFLVSLTPQEHEAVLRDEGLPRHKLVVPASWKKPAIPIVPDLAPMND
jgi:hypothetical protein